jgi:glycosyltransferase involved in cell wall biosynthesis
MRQGQNPAKMGLKTNPPKPLGICLLSYIPMMEGYYQDSLQVLKAQIVSIHATTSDFDLYVFDNGSCLEVTQELTDLFNKGFIHYLVLSHYNLGKTGALNWMLSSMPNEWICYSDGDILFRKGWFEKSKELFDTFPKVGLVSAQPVVYDVLNQSGRAIKDISSDPNFRIELQPIPQEIIDETTVCLALTKELVEGLKKKQIPILYNSTQTVKAVVGAAHDQFLTRNEIARQIVPLSAKLALSNIEDKKFNVKVDDLGFLQLSLPQSLKFHIGNKLDQNVKDEIEQLDVDHNLQNQIQIKERTNFGELSSSKKSGIRMLEFLSHIPGSDKFFRRIYNLLFEYYAK